MLRNFFVCLLSLSLVACASTKMTPGLQQGKYYYESGYYKRAIHYLLPLAVNGNAEAQYAIGYMYYYGYGVAQDTETGYFWMAKSAEQHYGPAVKALGMIKRG